MPSAQTDRLSRGKTVKIDPASKKKISGLGCEARKEALAAREADGAVCADKAGAVATATAAWRASGGCRRGASCPIAIR